MVIQQGDVFWVDLGDPVGSAPGYRHPHVVIQNNVFNRSRIATAVVVALTSNLARAAAPGNVHLHKGEAGLPKPSVVNVSQLFTVDRSQLVQRIGKLSSRRVQAIVTGLLMVLEPREVPE